MRRIASFSVDHDFIVPGIYISRVDGDVTTYDLRTRVPNCGDLMDNATMHSVEHMFATLIRNSAIGSSVIYFGPMGCQTGFYLLVRNADHQKVLSVIEQTLRDIIDFEGEIFGKSRKECGNYANLDLALAKAECRRYLEVVADYPLERLKYPQGPRRVIGIIAAMGIELETLKASISHPAETMLAGIRFISGTMFGKDVVCAVCGIGKVNAALCTQTMILAFHPCCIINTGVGGALIPDYKVCDVVIGQCAVQHDVDTCALGDEAGFVSTVNRIEFPLSQSLNEKLRKALGDLHIHAHFGVIATGDQFIATPEDKTRIHGLFGATVCEMEGGAIAHTCLVSGVPCAILRAISDGADAGAHLSYAEFAQKAADNSARALIRFMEAYAD